MPAQQKAACPAAVRTACLCSALLRRTFRPGETVAERRRKELVVGPFAWLALTGVALYGFVWHREGRYWDVFQAGALLTAAAAAGVVASAAARRRLSLRTAEAGIVAVSCALLLMDWKVRGEPGSPRMWVLNVLTCDNLLFVGASRRTLATVLGATLAYLAVSCTDDAFKWGFSGIDGWSTPDAALIRARNGCATPPCAVGAEDGASFFTLGASLFACDFMLTAIFARGMREQMALVDAAVAMSEELATLMAEYSVEEAQRIVDGGRGGELPPRLRAAFRAQLDNLRLYRPYLPQSVLEYSARDDRRSTISDSHNPVMHSRLGACWLENASSSSGSSSSSCTTGPSHGSHGSPLSPVTVTGYSFNSETRTQHGSTNAVLRHPPSVDHLPRGLRSVDASTRSRGVVSAFATRPPRGDASAYARSRSVDSTARAPRCDTPTNASCCKPRSVVRAGFEREPVSKKVSLMVANYCGFLSVVSDEPAARVAAWLEAVVTHGAACVAMERGLVDLLSADHLFASFSAARAVVAHRQAVVRAAYMVGSADAALDMLAMSAGVTGSSSRSPEFGALARLRASSAACSGAALCGDFGSATQQRFMCIGGVSSLVAAVDRLAARWEAPVVVNGDVYADVCTAWHCRLRGAAVYPKGSAEQLMLWEAVTQVHQPNEDPESPSVEWMYEFSTRENANNPWELYNTGMRRWIAGGAEVAGMASRISIEAAGAAAATEEIRAACAALLQRMACGGSRCMTLEEVVASQGGSAAAAPGLPPRSVGSVLARNRAEMNALRSAQEEDRLDQQRALNRRLSDRRMRTLVKSKLVGKADELTVRKESPRHSAAGSGATTCSSLPPWFQATASCDEQGPSAQLARANKSISTRTDLQDAKGRATPEPLIHRPYSIGDRACLGRATPEACGSVHPAATGSGCAEVTGAVTASKLTVGERLLRVEQDSKLTADGRSRPPPCVPFDDVEVGMVITMTPEGCMPGVDCFTGVVVDKPSQVKGGLAGNDCVIIKWHSPQDGGPPAKFSIPKQRAERRFWWEGEGRPRCTGVHQVRRRSLSQSLLAALRDLGLSDELYREALEGARLWRLGDVACVSSPDELPAQLPGNARSALLDLALDRARTGDALPPRDDGRCSPGWHEADAWGAADALDGCADMHKLIQI